MARRLHRDVHGASYSVSFVLMFPFFVLLTAAFIETTLLLNAKSAVTMAAFAAGRTAAVVIDAEYYDETNSTLAPAARKAANEKLRYGRIHAAVASALAPHASGDDEHSGLKPNGFDYPLSAGREWAAGHNDIGGSHDEAYLARKWVYAAKASRLEINPVDIMTGASIAAAEYGGNPHAGLEVTVEYEAPFFTSGVGRIFGERQPGGFFTKTIRSKVVVEKEGSKAEDGRLPFRNYYAMHDFRSASEPGLSVPLPDSPLPETGNDPPPQNDDGGATQPIDDEDPPTTEVPEPDDSDEGDEEYPYVPCCGAGDEDEGDYFADGSGSNEDQGGTSGEQPSGARRYTCRQVAKILNDIADKTLLGSFADHVGLGEYDFKTKEPDATFDVFGQAMNSAEFGNFIAGFAGQVNGWMIGADGVRIGGVIYDATDSFAYWLAEQLGFDPSRTVPPGMDPPSFDFDYDSWPAIEAGVALAKQYSREGKLPTCQGATGNPSTKTEDSCPKLATDLADKSNALDRLEKKITAEILSLQKKLCQDTSKTVTASKTTRLDPVVITLPDGRTLTVQIRRSDRNDENGFYEGGVITLGGALFDKSGALSPWGETVLANEMSHARDDARDGEFNDVYHKPDPEKEGGIKKLTYLENEARSDLAQAKKIRKLFCDPKGLKPGAGPSVVEQAMEEIRLRYYAKNNRVAFEKARAEIRARALCNRAYVLEQRAKTMKDFDAKMRSADTNLEDLKKRAEASGTNACLYLARAIVRLRYEKEWETLEDEVRRARDVYETQCGAISNESREEIDSDDDRMSNIEDGVFVEGDWHKYVIVVKDGKVTRFDAQPGSINYFNTKLYGRQRISRPWGPFVESQRIPTPDGMTGEQFIDRVLGAGKNAVYNSGTLDYSPAGGQGVAKGSQNSNRFVHDILEDAGYTKEIPSIWPAPGLNPGKPNTPASEGSPSEDFPRKPWRLPGDAEPRYPWMKDSDTGGPGWIKF